MHLMTKKEYLRPNTAVRPPISSDEWWTPPEPSQWLREFKFASKASTRGVLVVKNRCINFESGGERDALLKFLADRRTLKVVEQTPKVEWVDEYGEVHEHVFDMLVTKRVSSNAIMRVAVDVKPAAKVKSSGIRTLHKVIGRQISPEVADELLVFTEKKLTRADRYNVGLFHSVFKQEYPDDDRVILGLIRKMKDPCPIADLVTASKLAGYGFNASVRAIAVGHLALVSSVHITRKAIVAPVRED